MQVMVKREKWSIGAPLEIARQMAENCRKGFQPLLVTHDGRLVTRARQCSVIGVADAVKMLAQGKSKIAVFIDNQSVFFQGHEISPMTGDAIDKAIEAAKENGGELLSHIYVAE